ncbi:hypothetical protein EDB87DRAFT_1829762 [Lactarius vividus]|nr:hypothetical protein EDB87DRAFT_1829762 [Lactarius vividus]
MGGSSAALALSALVQNHLSPGLLRTCLASGASTRTAGYPVIYITRWLWFPISVVLPTDSHRHISQRLPTQGCISCTPDHVLNSISLTAAAVDRSRYTCRADIISPPRNLACPHRLTFPAPVALASANSSREIQEGTRARSLGVVRLEEMAARAAAETEAKATPDKTLPALPVPSGKPLGHSELRRPSAQDIFGKLKPLEQE